jgi:wyosine [tRNA(Phe)-imidazoG37] synthetase (radical SAM superfamily)
MSLGVDLVPKKVCSLDCVYCEVGKTTKLTTERMAYVPLEKVTREIDHYFGHHPDPDYITFSGSGEPTLNIHIGEVLNYIKKTKPDIPVAVLTNGTLLHDKQLRTELLGADVVLPSLDAASEGVFKAINRPDKKLSADKLIRGLIEFRNEFPGKIWLEVFILPGYNDTPEELERLKNAIDRIGPDSVQLNTLDRPGTVRDLKSASIGSLSKIADRWGYEHTEIIAKPLQRKKLSSYRSDRAGAILETIVRRPCTVDDLSEILGLHVNEINKYLDVLEEEGRIRSHEQERGIFYMISPEK